MAVARYPLSLSIALLMAFMSGALGGPLDTAPLPLPGDRDTRAAVGLARSEFEEIVAEVEKTSFDVSDNWEAELRLRPIPMGKSEGLIVRGSTLLCGATGNCQTWLMRRENGRWMSLFVTGGATPPIITGFGFGDHISHELPDVIVAAHISANLSSYDVYVFDGHAYQSNRCYEVAVENGRDDRERARPVDCR
jgi:hypothetical protein